MSQPAARMATSDSLIIFTRYPQAGQTKTRLIPALGAAGAAKLQRQMTEHLVEQLLPFCIERRVHFDMHFTGGSQAQMQDWLGPDVTLTPQRKGTLGEKLIYALAQAFSAGKTRVVMIGSDCPMLSSSEIDRALILLESEDVVLGPAADGGYYLIGLRSPNVCLFENIPWGTDGVLATTQAIARKQNLSVGLLGELADIDRPEDLPIWEAQRSNKL